MNDHVAELRSLKSDRGFGLGAGVFLALLLLLGRWKGWWAVPAATPLLVLSVAWGLAILMPPAWRPLRRGWMALGHGLGWFNSRVIYSLAFLLLFAPVAFLVRRFGGDPLDPEPTDEASSHWIPRPPPRTPDSYLEPY